MRTFIWSFLYKIDGQYNTDMLQLWYDHLRGPAGYQGDIYLVTNLTDVNIPGLKILPITQTLTSVKQVQVMCILMHDQLPWDQYDVGMYMDMDILAIRDVSPLFAKDESLQVASSNFSIGHPKHAGFFFSPIRRFFQKLFNPTAKRPGVNTCCFSTLSEHRQATLGKWKSIIESHDPNNLPPLGDQSFLNLALLTNQVSVSKHSMATIAHSQWDQADDAILWHFPLGDIRLQKMHEFSRLAQNTGESSS